MSLASLTIPSQLWRALSLLSKLLRRVMQSGWDFCRWHPVKITRRWLCVEWHLQPRSNNSHLPHRGCRWWSCARYHQGFSGAFATADSIHASTRSFLRHRLLGCAGLWSSKCIAFFYKSNTPFHHEYHGGRRWDMLWSFETRWRYVKIIDCYSYRPQLANSYLWHPLTYKLNKKLKEHLDMLMVCACLSQPLTEAYINTNCMNCIILYSIFHNLCIIHIIHIIYNYK